jgi:hypothetical protein
MSRVQFWRVCHTNLSAVDLVICGCWLHVGLVCCSVYDMWGRGGRTVWFWGVCRLTFSATPFAASFSIPYLPLPLSLRRTATRGDRWGAASGGDWRGAACNGDWRPAASGGGATCGGGGETLLPSASLPVSWICFLFLLFGDVLPLILCGFASFHCLLHVVAVYDLALGFHFPVRWVWFL